MSIAAFLGFFFILTCAIWQFVQRHQLEKTLRLIKEQNEKRERKMSTILNNAPIVFSAVDSNGIFQISEGKGLEKLGRKSNESVGQSIFEMHRANPAILEIVKRALCGESVETSFALNGIYYDLFIGPEIDSSGKVVGASMLSVDITDRKKSEDEKGQLLIREQAALETSKLKSEFLANMSHEIRTPINGVLGMTSLLLDTPLTDQQREFADAIKQSGSGLLAVINDILDFSKIEAGKLDFESIDFQFPELITHTMKTMKLLADQKGIIAWVEFATDLPAWVKGDPGRLRQILNNLLGNAIKFTAEGEVSLKVKRLTQDKENFFRVEVSDTGIGMSKEAQAKMFTAFAQGEASMARRFGGTGLGLSICKQLVRKMGGEIGVESELGQGSTFWFELPFLKGEAQEITGPSPLLSLRNLKSIKTGVPKILVAEDNRVNQIITVKMLEKMGFASHVVENGIRAIEEVSLAAYDLVLMDCQMPEMDGLEATQKIRSTDLKMNRGIPIIAMTANAMTGDREKCLAAGMDDYVSKPVSYDELSAVLKRWLEIRSKQAS